MRPRAPPRALRALWSAPIRRRRGPRAVGGAVGAPLRCGDRARLAASAGGARLRLGTQPARRRAAERAGFHEDGRRLGVGGVCARRARLPGSKGRAVPHHRRPGGAGRSTRHRAARAVSASYTPSARRSTPTAYVAVATAAAGAQRFAAAQRLRVAMLCFVFAAGISAGRRWGTTHMGAASTRRPRASQSTMRARRA